MEYIIDRDSLFPLIDEEVSRVANEAYSEDGASLYDGIIITSADRRTIGRLEDDAINSLIKRTSDICRPVPGVFRETEGTTLIQVLPRLSFDVPDFDEGLNDVTVEEITRYIVLNVCAAWFQSRYPGKVEEFAGRGQVAMDKAVTLLKTIKAPRRV